MYIIRNKTFNFLLIRIAIFLVLVFSIDRLLNHYLLEGITRYFGLKQSTPILAIGHSHTVLGINKFDIEKKINIKITKYARSGANLRDRKAMIAQYFNLHPKDTKLVMYDVDSYLFTEAQLSRNSYQLFYPYMDSKPIKKHILDAHPSWQELTLREVFKTSRYSEILVAQSMRGWLKKWTNLKTSVIDTDRLKKQISLGLTRKIEFNIESQKLFQETLEDIIDEGAKVLLVYIPTIDLMNDSNPKEFNKIITYYEKLAENNDDIYFINYNEPFSHQHELFFDPEHLNVNGQNKITEALAKDLKIIIQK